MSSNDWNAPLRPTTSRASGSGRLASIALSAPVQLNPKQYAESVAAYAQSSSAQSLYPGIHLTNLADFLLRPFRRRPIESETTIPLSSQPEYPCVLLYDLKQGPSSPGTAFSSISDLVSYQNQVREPGSTKLLFLRGHLSADWLNVLGSKFTIDPEFLALHLDFQRTSTSRPGLILPLLPSATVTITRLRLNTVASRMDNSPVSQRSSQGDLDNLRHEVKTSFLRYLDALRHGGDLNLCPGDSVVRDFSILSPQYAVIEQDISVYLETIDGGYFIIAWLDTAKDLFKTSPGPWNSGSLMSSRWSLKYLAIPQILPFAALNYQLLLAAQPKPTDARIPQSASLLPLNYFQFPHVLEVDRGDSILALRKLFRFAAASENLALNAVEATLQHELEPDVILTQASLSIANLLHTKSFLERHITRLKENVAFLDHLLNQGSVQPENSKRMSHSIHHDVSFLLHRAQLLSSKCDRGLDVISTQASIREAAKGIEQARTMAKLTRLALPFIPLSLTTSFFGMNFSELGNSQPLSIWVWFVTSAIVLLVTFVFLVWDRLDVAGRVSYLGRKIKHKKDDNSRSTSAGKS